MVRAYYEDWSSLVAGAQDACNYVLANDIRKTAVAELYRKIKDVTYGSYQPRKGAWKHGDSPDNTYQRRYSLLHRSVGGSGGLFYDIWDYNTLLVSSKARAMPSVVKGYSFHHRYDGALLALLESDNHGFLDKNPGTYGFPRLAVSDAEEALVPKLETIMTKNFEVIDITK